MSKAANQSLRDEENRLANLAPDELATNEEAVALPWLAGEAKLPARWLSPIYKPFTTKVAAGAGKK
jgi:hypothetical protein